MIKAPCMTCNERHVNCHSDCIKYKEWKEEQDRERERILQVKRLDWVVIEQKRSAINKIRRIKST